MCVKVEMMEEQGVYVQDGYNFCAFVDKTVRLVLFPFKWQYK